MNNHGGAREGSGRKPKENKKIIKAVRLSPEILESIQKLYPNRTLSSIIEEALNKLIKEGKES